VEANSSTKLAERIYKVTWESQPQEGRINKFNTDYGL